MLKIKKIITMILFVFILTMFFSIPVLAYDRNGAINYADTHWNNYNTAHYRTMSGDCSNFVSQIMHDGGGKTMNNDWYYWGYYQFSTSWSVADDLKWYVKDVLGSTRLVSAWTKYGSNSSYAWKDNSANIPATGDVVIFYDWDANGVMNHASYCVGRGTDYNSHSWGQYINQHSPNRQHAIWNLDPYMTDYQRAHTRIYAFQLPA